MAVDFFWAVKNIMGRRDRGGEGEMLGYYAYWHELEQRWQVWAQYTTKRQRLMGWFTTWPTKIRTEYSFSGLGRRIIASYSTIRRHILKTGEVVER